MKKITLFLFALSLIARPLLAQDDDKSFKFGLKIVPSVNWYKPDDKKKFESAGTNIKFSYGLMTEFKLAGSAWFSTGLQVDYDGGKMTFKDTVGYFVYDDQIINFEDTAGKSATMTAYKLDERKYRATYVTLPLTLRLRTKEVGAMTYYGQFGFPLSIKLKAKADDQVRAPNYTTGGYGPVLEQKDLDITGDMGFLNIGLTVGAGAEYNLSGSTSLIFGLNYTQGFLNTVRSESKQLVNDDVAPEFHGLKQKFFSRNVSLMIGIAF